MVLVLGFCFGFDFEFKFLLLRHLVLELEFFSDALTLLLI